MSGNYGKKATCKCSVCKEVRTHHGRGLCGTCYKHEKKLPGFENKWKRTNLKRKQSFICKNCKTETKHAANGLCGFCYTRFDKPKQQTKESKAAGCNRCNQLKPIFSRGVCRSCYYNMFEKSKKTTSNQRPSVQAPTLPNNRQPSTSTLSSNRQQIPTKTRQTRLPFSIGNSQTARVNNVNPVVQPRIPEPNYVYVSSGDEDENYYRK